MLVCIPAQARFYASLAELERERLTSSEAQRKVQRLQREVREVEGLLEERQESDKGAKNLWGKLRRNNR